MRLSPTFGMCKPIDAADERKRPSGGCEKQGATAGTQAGSCRRTRLRETVCVRIVCGSLRQMSGGAGSADVRYCRTDAVKVYGGAVASLEAMVWTSWYRDDSVIRWWLIDERW